MPAACLELIRSTDDGQGRPKQEDDRWVNMMQS